MKVHTICHLALNKRCIVYTLSSGELRLSSNSTGFEGEHWREMEQQISSEQGVTKEHYLKPSRSN